MRNLFSPLLVLLLAVALTACAEEGNTVATPGTALETPGFEGIPTPEAAQPMTEPVAVDEVLSQTIEVKGSTPEDIVAFYERALDESWDVALEPAPVGLGEEVHAGSPGKIYQVGFTDGEQDLLVSARPGDNVQDSIVYLVIGPTGSDVFDVDAIR